MNALQEYDLKAMIDYDDNFISYNYWNFNIKDLQNKWPQSERNFKFYIDPADSGIYWEDFLEKYSDLKAHVKVRKFSFKEKLKSKIYLHLLDFELVGRAETPFIFSETKYGLTNENIDGQCSGQSTEQFTETSKEKVYLGFSSSVYPCQGIIKEFKDSIEEIKWLDEATLEVRVHVIITCHNKIENIDYEIIDNKIFLKFEEVGYSMANCVCDYNIIYMFKDLEKKEYIFELIKIK